MVTKEQLDEYIRLYNQGNPAISDSEYDALLEEYLQNNGGESNRPFLRSKQSDDVNDLVGTLPKAYGVITPMREGQRTYEQFVKTKKLPDDQQIIIQPKFDGVSVGLTYDTNTYCTRGDYDDGTSVDVSELFNIRMIPRDTGATAIKFEAIMAEEHFKYLTENHMFSRPQGYERPRDAVQAIISSRNKNLAQYITLVPLRVYYRDDDKRGQGVPKELRELSITTAHVSDFDTIQQFITDKLDDGATVTFNNLTYAIDGVVVTPMLDEKFTDVENEIAIKILNISEKTRLKTVEYQLGKTGRITPVAILEDVKFGNITVNHVTLSTLDRMASLNLKYGDTVHVMYNIVPYLLRSEHDGTIPVKLPTHCPICNAPLDMSTLKIVKCSNPDCEGLKLGSIIRYCEKMKMMGLSTGVLTKFYDLGIVTSIPELYKLTVSDLENLPGFGTKSAQNVVESIRKYSSNVKLYNWLGAFPMNDVSQKTWKTLLTAVFKTETEALNQVSRFIHLDGDESALADLLIAFGNISGIGRLTMSKIVYGLKRNWYDMKQVFPYIKFTTDDSRNVSTEKGRITLTGIHDKDLIRYFNQLGYEVGDFSKSKTKYVVIPDDTFVSNKVTAAKASGIPVYTVQEAVTEKRIQ